ncbi:MAG: LCP family protein [Clostridiales bacterium]|nr:LCP family protein [Clostridiales bacterium]
MADKRKDLPGDAKDDLLSIVPKARPKPLPIDFEACAPPPEATQPPTAPADSHGVRANENPWEVFAPPPEALRWEGEPPPVIPLPPLAPPPTPLFQLDKTADELWGSEDSGEGLPPLDLDRPTEKKTKKTGHKKKRRPGRVKRFFTWLLVLALAVTGLLGGGAFLAAGQMNLKPIDQANAAAIANAPRGNIFVTNILLIGVDGSPGNSRADTLLLLSIDRRTATLKLTSILRDSWVRFPNGSYKKINEATVGNAGGGALAARVVSENFGVRVDHYMLLSFNAFEKIINAIGGISVPITQREINFLARETRLGRQIGKAEMERQMARNGVVKLNGIQALIFVRIRYVDDDFMRAGRQRIMLDAVMGRIKRNPLRLIPLAVSAVPEIHSSVSRLDAALLAMQAPAFAFFSLEQHQLPAPGTFRNSTRGGLFIFDLDIAENGRLLRKFIYG